MNIKERIFADLANNPDNHEPIIEKYRVFMSKKDLAEIEMATRKALKNQKWTLAENDVISNYRSNPEETARQLLELGFYRSKAAVVRQAWKVRKTKAA